MTTRFELFCDFIKAFKRLNNFKEKNIHFENSKLSCIPLKNVLKEKNIITYTIKYVKEKKKLLGIANFLQTDVFVEIINNYFQKEKKYKLLNEDEMYMCVFACLIDVHHLL